jgi:hypothetical protein
MKKALAIIIITSLSITNSFSQDVWPDRTRVLPQKLRRVPVGLSMWHDRPFIVPEKTDSTYFWKHTTTIRAEVADLEFIEAGSFIWYDASGWKQNMVLNRQDLAEDFGCKDGKFPKSKPFVFKKNWRRGRQPYGGDALWYVLAKDKKGVLYKGYALVETEDL